MMNINTGGQCKPIAVVAQEALAKFKPPTFGIPLIDQYLYGWKKHANVILSGMPGSGFSDLALTLAEKFASNDGPVIWIGVEADLRNICLRLVYREAGIEIFDVETVICLDDVGRQIVEQAHKRIIELPLDFCDIDQWDDPKLETEFLTAVTSDKPTLIVLEASVFDETGMDPLQVLVRRVNIFRLVESLKISNKNWRILWQVPVSQSFEPANEVELTVDHLDEPTVLADADVIMFAHVFRPGLTKCACLDIVKNKFGSIGKIPMDYDSWLSDWSEPS